MVRYVYCVIFFRPAGRKKIHKKESTVLPQAKTACLQREAL